ncbi:hypothetical protein B0T24DRAFT_648286 [Lasiosphaeria ovina]|uniref:Uncharacterized protein n=1 Tax=Lasiosphaeria ovina TaxID=92902 RepID=A0AAE0N9Z9_9PEZI|nr:hypothetical protein B0T24DRAFT_648286 [Lasiosphaeria ovina]
MQFLSQSMGWADNIMLAMAPLGIITVIISAIRVGGPSWLKAVIGRARGNLAVAEAELMSSTSKDVCELWNGEHVVRMAGKGPIREFLLVLPAQMTLGELKDKTKECFKIVMGVLVYSGFVTYYPALAFLKDGMPVAPHAYPLTAGGTLILVSGMLICSHVVESSTVETRHRVKSGKAAQVIWLQRAGTVNDQSFASYAIFADGLRSVITTKTPQILQVKAVLGTIISICGFLVQFVGLRGMHWSASIAQLGATLVMTVLRTLVRRRLAEPLLARRLSSGYEIEWLAMPPPGKNLNRQCLTTRAGISLGY